MLVVPFCVRVSFLGLYGGRPWANILDVFWDIDDQSLRNDNLDSFAINEESIWANRIAPLLVDELTLTAVNVQDLHSEDGALFSLSSSENGNLATEGMPPNVSVLVTKSTSHNRSQRNGRWFQCGGQEAITEAPNLADVRAGDLATWQGAFSSFRTDHVGNIAGGVTESIVLSRSASAPSGFTPRVITQMTVQTRLATQRRRLRG